MSNYSEQSLLLTVCGIKYVNFLRPDINNIYLSQNLMYGIDIFEVRNCWENPNMDRVPNPIGKRVVPVIWPSTRPYLKKP